MNYDHTYTETVVYRVSYYVLGGPILYTATIQKAKLIKWLNERPDFKVERLEEVVTQTAVLKQEKDLADVLCQLEEEALMF